MKFTYMIFLLLFLVLFGCKNVSNNNTSNDTSGSATAVKACVDSSWSQTGNEPNCIACPSDSKVNANKTFCVCNDKNLTFSFSANKCKKKLSAAIRNAFLSM